MVIQTNIANLLGQNSLRLSERDFRMRLERLSSGLRINKGADDPSGLAISQGMCAQIRGLSTSIQNLQDGVNMLNTVDGAAAELQDMVQRMRDLSVRAANEATLTVRDREIIQNEITSLASAMRQMSLDLKFNSKDLNGKGKIVFQSDRTGDSDVFTMDANGANQVNITNMPGTQRNASPSPDGSHISYDSFIGNWDVIVDLEDGGDPINVSNHPSEDLWKSWSPDGEQLVFRTFRDGNYELYSVNKDGTNLVNLSNDPGIDTVPAMWSPDGSRIVFVSLRDGNQELYVVDSDGSNLTNLTNNAGEDFWPVWSPDGSKLAFTSTRDGNYEIYVMDEDGTNLVNVSNAAAFDQYPAWSPDSSKLVFTSPRNGSWNIYMVNADGSGLKMVSDNAAQDLYPFWSPDSTTIGFASVRGGDWDIYIVDPNSGEPATNLTNTAGYDFATQTGWYLSVLDLNIQAGPNSSDHFELNLRPVSPQTLGVAGLRVTTMKQAGRGIELCDHALAYLGDYRAELGAMSRRIEHIIDDNTAMHINVSAARSRIRDADMARETVAITRAAIMRASTTDMLSNEQNMRQATMDILINAIG